MKKKKRKFKFFLNENIFFRVIDCYLVSRWGGLVSLEDYFYYEVERSSCIIKVLLVREESGLFIFWRVSLYEI